MQDDVILAHDVGTSGTKTSLVRADGTIQASETTPHPTYSAAPGQSEQDPASWWAGVCQNTRALLEGCPAARKRIAGIGVSGHMLGCLPIDAGGSPLRHSLIHSDCRALAEADQVDRAVGAEPLYRITGNRLDARSPLCKMLWLKANEPHVYRRAARFLQCKDYIVGRLTGAFETTDLSDASHAQWLDVRAAAPARELLDALGLDAGKLPEPHRATDVVGGLCPDAARALGLPTGIPVVAGGGDGSCATVGAGAVHAGDTYCCIGTTAWIASVREEPFLGPGMRVFNILSLDGKGCGVFGTVQCAGRSLEWALQLLGETGFSRFEALLESAPAGSDGLLFLPYLEGERSPIWDPKARGVFFGITPQHRREHLLRAVVEGVSFALRSVLEVMRETRPIPAMRLIGGGGQSQAWQQMLADVCRCSIQPLVGGAADATSVGAAIAAGVGVGLFRDLGDAARIVSVASSRAPRGQLAATYDRTFARFTALYPCLQPAFAEL